VKSWWVCPGGGLNEGEDVRDGLRREAFEELGLVDIEPGAEIWHRRHVFPWAGRVFDQRERFFVLRVPERFEPAPDLGDSLFEEGIREQRWWTIEAIARSEEDHLEFAPRRLAELLRTLITEGPPPAPIDVGV
jgi:8-oxo-dGTP pyrophosphatase MutT (NUDIX family)